MHCTGLRPPGHSFRPKTEADQLPGLPRRKSIECSTSTVNSLALSGAPCDSTFPVWRIDGPAPELKGRFVVTDGAVDGITGTDGLDALGGPVGEAFPEGVVVIQDDVNDVGTQNFKYIDWRDIRAALNL